MKVYVVLDRKYGEIKGIFNTYEKALEALPVFAPSVIIETEIDGYLITQKLYDELCDRDEKLSALEMGGVDNWEWYEESLKDYFGNEE